MGILKKHESEYGVEASYWNIGAIKEDFYGKSLEVTLFGFINEGSRRAGKRPLSIAVIPFNPTQYAPDLSRDEIYKLVKTCPDFIEAEDC